MKMTLEKLNILLDAAENNRAGFWGTAHVGPMPKKIKNGVEVRNRERRGPEILGDMLEEKGIFATTIDQDIRAAREWLEKRPELAARFDASVESWVAARINEPATA